MGPGSCGTGLDTPTVLKEVGGIALSTGGGQRGLSHHRTRLTVGSAVVALVVMEELSLGFTLGTGMGGA